MLSESGKLGFITPNSYFKNSSHKAFRNYLCNSGILHKLINYGDSKVFDGADTYTTITILDKEKNNKKLYYTESNGTKDLFGVTLDLSSFKSKDNWAFGNKEDNLFLEQNSRLKTKLGSICNIQYGVCTNRDKVYIGKYIPKTKKTGIFNGFEVEKSILRPVVKVSTYNGVITDMILFPYYWDKSKSKYEPIKESVLRKKYPLAYKYLLHHKESLESRNMDNNASTWYQFARSQGLVNMNNNKLLVKHIFNSKEDKLTIYEVPKHVIIYAGIYVTVSDKERKRVDKILNSRDLCRYLKLLGKDMSGGYKFITPKYIKSYGIK